MMLKKIAFLLLFFSGCNHVPQEEMAKVFNTPSLEKSTKEAFFSSFFEEGGWPTEEWWEMLNDPQLDALIKRALKNSPTLQKAFAKVEEVEQEAKKQRARLFPHLGLNYEENWQYFSKNGFVRSFFPSSPGAPIPATINQIDLTLNFSYEIDFFGRNQKQFQAALGMARAQRAEAQMTKLLLTTLIAQTYIELQIKLSQKEILLDHQKKIEKIYALTSSRHQYGIDAQMPVLEEEEGIYLIDQSIIDIKKEIALDYHVLAQLVGVGPNEVLIEETMQVLFDRPFPLPSYLSNNLIARRPDLTAQIWKVEAAAQTIQVAQRDFYPRVNLLAFAGVESLSFNQLFSISSRQGAVQPAIYLPLFTGGRLKANLKEKVALFNEEVHHYNELLLMALKEVADQLVTLSSCYEILESQWKKYQAAFNQVDLQSLRYKKGTADFLTVLKKQNRLLDESVLLLKMERNYLLSIVKLVKALGGGYDTSYLPDRKQLTAEKEGF